jgi:hypothetical protein
MLALVSFACSAGRTDGPASLVNHVVVSPAGAQATRTAGDVTGTARPDRSAAEIARLRAEGPPALAALLADFDKLDLGPARDALAATIDKVAGQRYATVSRLFWHTDLEAAKQAARASGKPILSLRMLGRLDEDLSCSNSRFFRTVLYSDRVISELMREGFVLHWSTEREVPRVTIDFGDGRKIERTLTGNSAHYVLGADGLVIDVLPGMYAPPVFAHELAVSRGFAKKIMPLEDPVEIKQLIDAHHDEQVELRRKQWATLGAYVDTIGGSGRLFTPEGLKSEVARAQKASMSKAIVEVADLQRIDVGPDPGTLEGIDVWATIGQRLYDIQGPGILDEQSKALVLALIDTAPVKPLDPAQRQAVLDRLEQSIVADAAQNQLVHRQRIDLYLMSEPDRGFASVNEWLYRDVFRTPAQDPWLGLLPRDGFTALPSDGVVLP